MSKKTEVLTVEAVKKLGKEKSEANLKTLLAAFETETDVDVKREIVSSIGRQTLVDDVYNFIRKEAFNERNPMEFIYQMYRTCLYKGKEEEKFKTLGEEILRTYDNENLYKMKRYYDYRQKRQQPAPREQIKKPTLLVGDAAKTLKMIPPKSIDMVFTSPPYYNAREYSDYHSYNEYLQKMKDVFVECARVLDDGRFMIVNISPVITKRAGREFESIRYPIPYDFHRILTEAGFYFVDEIQWVKPEPSVPNRIGGYLQTRRPLAYKPNCITETIMVYRKNCDFLLDKNVAKYKDYERYEDEPIDTSNCWYIAPKADKDHPAIFPEELCKKVLRYYSFEQDAVLDPFAGSGTLGRVAHEMHRIPVMCERNDTYVELIKTKGGPTYDIQRWNN